MIRITKPSRQVIPTPTGWVVVKTGEVKISAKFTDLSDAVDFAKRDRTVVYIYNAVGRIVSVVRP